MYLRVSVVGQEDRGVKREEWEGERGEGQGKLLGEDTRTPK